MPFLYIPTANIYPNNGFFTIEEVEEAITLVGFHIHL